ncbi:HupE/UreJ family protein [Limnohabitans sp. Rim8]|uniref:HupE/UreJ family protein n=1 Tax=Limnohabitans sp. Rim8 TaxID=1100718 RepID=UPI002628B6D4|nr:HupE/UreJ family protein [Limnohabitans sp. Rim8]
MFSDFSQLLKHAVLSILLLVGAAGVCAHEMTMADLTMREVAPKEFVWSWGIPGKNTPVSQDLTPVWPEGCMGDARTVRCGERGLAGSLSVNGIGKNYSAVILRITWQGEQRSTFTLTQNQSSVRLFGAARDERDAWQVAQTYAVLGIEHILSGIDHLLFVLSLLFLVGFRRQLLATITLFTVAHSLTLAASALGALTLRSPPVEAVIALSIVLVCAEALSQKDTLTRRWPGIVAFVFGLIHGLGFAGALKDIGLPEQHANIALLTINLGVEAGQLLVIGLAWLVLLATRRFVWTASARRVILYGIGSVSVFWTFSRIAVIAG